MQATSNSRSDQLAIYAVPGIVEMWSFIRQFFVINGVKDPGQSRLAHDRWHLLLPARNDLHRLGLDFSPWKTAAGTSIVPNAFCPGAAVAVPTVKDCAAAKHVVR